MTEVTDFIAETLIEYQHVEPIAGGYRHKAEHGTTTLSFRPPTSSTEEVPLLAIATVETRFASEAIPEFTDEGIAWINRRAVIGSFFRDADGIGLRLTYSLWKDDPAARWTALHLLDAFGQQLAFGVGVSRMDTPGKHYHASRRELDVPRRWAKALPPDGFEEVAQFLRQHWSFVATADPSKLVFEVPLAAGAWTQAADPDAETAFVCIRTDVQHPLAGVGYCATITLTRQPPPELLTMWCTRLNALEHQQEDFAPRLGAWGKRDLGMSLVYGMFWPVDQAGVNPATNVAMGMAMRALWIRKHFWRPGVGLSLREEGAD